MARVYADVNQNMPRAYWDYDSVNISTSSTQRASPATRPLFPDNRDVARIPPHLAAATDMSCELGWGVLENYEVVRKIGQYPPARDTLDENRTPRCLTPVGGATHTDTAVSSLIHRSRKV